MAKKSKERKYFNLRAEIGTGVARDDCEGYGALAKMVREMFERHDADKVEITKV